MSLREQKAEYVAQYSGKVAEARLNRYLDAGIEFFEARGIDIPTEGDYELWREEQKTRPGQKGEPRSDKTVRDYVREYRNFTAWRERRNQMTLEEIAEATPEAMQGVHEPESASRVQGVHEQEAESPLPVEVEQIAPKPRGNVGRKVKDKGGEKRSEKIMLYLTPSLMTDIKDLASLYGKSLTEYVISLIEAHAELKQGKLASFRELRDNE